MSDPPRSRTRRFLGAIALRFGSDALVVGFRVALLAIVTRHLDQRNYGLFSQASTSAMMIMPLFSLRLSVACVRFFPELAGDRRQIWSRFAPSLLIIVALGSAGSCVASLLAGALAGLIFDDISHAALAPLLVAYAAAQALLMHTIDFYRAVNETQKSSLLNVVRSLANLLAASCVVRWALTPAAVLLALTAADSLLAALIVVTIAARTYAAPRRAAAGSEQRWRAFKPYLTYALPFVPYSLFVLAGAVVDRFFITHWLGIASAGRYGFSYGIVSSAMLMSNAIAYVLLPSIARLWEQGDRPGVRALLAQGQSLSLYFSVPIACGLTLVYPPLVRLIAGEGFGIDQVSIAAIAVGHVFLGLFTVNSYVVDLAKRSVVLLRIAAAALLVNTTLNVLLIPKLQLRGAALATALTYLAQWWVLRRQTQGLVGFTVPFSPRIVLVVLLAAACMLAGIAPLELSDARIQLLSSVSLGATTYVLVTALGVGRATRSQLRASLRQRD